MGGSPSKSKKPRKEVDEEPKMTRLEETKWNIKTQISKFRASANAAENAISVSDIFA